jgi:hypothetical protein
MRNFMEAYAAVHNQQAREESNSSRDTISEMNLSQLTDGDLNEIVEEVLEDIFEVGYSVDEAYNIFADMFVESEIVGRQQKIDRLCEALNKGFEQVESKAANTALEEFRKYRHGKKLQETWSDKLNQDKRIQKHHSAITAQESLNVRNLLIQLFNEKSGSKPDYIDADGDGNKKESMKKAFKDKDENPAKEEEKLRKDDDLFGSPNKKKKVSEAIDPKGAARMDAAKGKKAETQDEKHKRLMLGKYAPGAKKVSEGSGYNTYGATSPKQHAGQMKAMAGASNSTGDREKAKAATMRPAKNKIVAKSAMGESQGYNDRLDDSLGAKDKGKKSKQSMKDRRDESEGEEKSKGKRKYSGDKSMDKDSEKCEGVVWSQSELDAINAKIDAWNEEGPAYPYETKAQAKAQKDHRKGKSSKGIKTGVNAPNYEASRTSGANRQD